MAKRKPSPNETPTLKRVRTTGDSASRAFSSYKTAVDAAIDVLEEENEDLKKKIINNPVITCCWNQPDEIRHTKKVEALQKELENEKKKNGQLQAQAQAQELVCMELRAELKEAKSACEKLEQQLKVEKEGKQSLGGATALVQKGVKLEKGVKAEDKAEAEESQPVIIKKEVE